MFIHCGAITSCFGGNCSTIGSSCIDVHNTSSAPCGIIESTTGTCKEIVVFALLITTVMYFLFCGQVPATMTTLGVVNEEEQGLAMGLGSFIYRALGAIPGPLVVGAALDESCSQWSETVLCLFLKKNSHFYLRGGGF